MVQGVMLVEVGWLQGARSPTKMCDIYCCSRCMPNFKLVLQSPLVRAMPAHRHCHPQYCPVPWLMLYGLDSLEAVSVAECQGKKCYTGGS